MEVNPLSNVWLYRPFHLLSASECKHLRTGRTEVKGSWMGGLCYGQGCLDWSGTRQKTVVNAVTVKPWILCCNVEQNYIICWDSGMGRCARLLGGMKPQSRRLRQLAAGLQPVGAVLMWLVLLGIGCARPAASAFRGLRGARSCLLPGTLRLLLLLGSVTASAAGDRYGDPGGSKCSDTGWHLQVSLITAASNLPAVVFC